MMTMIEYFDLSLAYYAPPTVHAHNIETVLRTVDSGGTGTHWLPEIFETW